MIRTLSRWLASLWLAVGILLILAAILISANWLAGYDVTVGALRRDWYGSLWFIPLLLLLMVNLTACTIKRKPWKFWQWGFLITHTGILTLMIGAGISFQLKVYGDMRIQEGQTLAEFELEKEYELRATQGTLDRRYPVDVNVYRRSLPGSFFHLSKGTGVRLAEFVPSVADEEVYTAASAGGTDMIEARMHPGQGRALTFFVPLNDTIGNGLINFTYLANQPELYRNLSEAAGERGTLVLTFGEESREIDVAASLDQPIVIAGRTITVKKFYSTFIIGDDLNPVEEPGRGDDFPAVAFDVAFNGTSETYYAFVLDPSLSPMKRGGRAHGSSPPDFKAAFRYVPRKSVVWFFLLPEGSRFVVTSKTGRVESAPLVMGDKIRHPFTPEKMGLHFEAVRRIEHAVPTIREEPPRKDRPTLPAVRLELVKGAEPVDPAPIWLRLGESVRLPAGEEAITVAFLPKTVPDFGLEVSLLKFRNPPHEGTGRALKFESDLRIFDRVTGQVVEGTTGVNYPVGYRGWLFYQSAYNDQVRPVMSILQVAYDPGKRVLYLGFIMAASGTIFMFFLKQHLIKLVQAAKKASDPPMGSAEPVLWLSFACIGTIGVMIAMLTVEALHPLWMGALMCAINVIAGFALAGFARLKSEKRPGWSLQLGTAISAGWCINTAAFVLYMIIRVPA